MLYFSRKCFWYIYLFSYKCISFKIHQVFTLIMLSKIPLRLLDIPPVMHSPGEAIKHALPCITITCSTQGIHSPPFVLLPFFTTKQTAHGEKRKQLKSPLCIALEEEKEVRKSLRESVREVSWFDPLYSMHPRVRLPCHAQTACRCFVLFLRPFTRCHHHTLSFLASLKFLPLLL